MSRSSALRFAPALLLGLGACSGGSCAGLAPLPSGFPPEAAVESGAAVRITPEGFDFLEQNAGALVSSLGGGASLVFDIPESQGTIFNAIDYTICAGGPDPGASPAECQVSLDAAGAALTIDPVPPHTLSLSGPVPFLLAQLPLHLDAGCAPILGCVATSDVILAIDGDASACPGTSFTPLPLTGLSVDLAVDTDPAHVRHGYTAVKVEDIGDDDIDTDALLAALHFCPADPADSDDVATADLLNQLDGLVFAGMKATLYDTLNQALGALPCQAADLTSDTPCPDGSAPNDAGLCMYADGACVTSLLGIDGHADVGALLASVAPGGAAALDLVVASGGPSQRPDGTGLRGDLEAIAGGATLGFLAGTRPAPISGCVPPSNALPPKDVPIPDELRDAALPDWPANLGAAPHLGLAFSERFLTYALAGVYDSGAICIGLSADALEGLGLPLQLSTSNGVLLGAPSMRDLGLGRDAAPLALYLHPLEAPIAEVGSGDTAVDPLLRVVLPKVALDVYAWSYDRYVRVLTATFLLRADVGLLVDAAGITPQLGDLAFEGVTVSTTGLVSESPEAVAKAIQGLFDGDLVKGAITSLALPAIDVGTLLAPLGLGLSIPPEGLRKLSKDNDDYLGVFANLTAVGP
jgi:hypothetical protein